MTPNIITVHFIRIIITMIIIRELLSLFLLRLAPKRIGLLFPFEGKLLPIVIWTHQFMRCVTHALPDTIKQLSFIFLQQWIKSNRKRPPFSRRRWHFYHWSLATGYWSLVTLYCCLSIFFDFHSTLAICNVIVVENKQMYVFFFEGNLFLLKNFGIIFS